MSDPPLDITHLVNPDTLSSLENRVKRTLATLPSHLLDAGRRGFPDEHNQQLLQSAGFAHADTLNVLSEALQYLEDAQDTILGLQEQVESSLEQICAAIAPVRQLPVELLQFIFQLVRQLDWRSSRRPPVVAQVCQLWRQVALETPSLWSEFTLRLDPRKLSSQLARLSLSIQRRGNQPLMMLVHDVETTVYGEPLEPPITEELMEGAGVAIALALEPHGSRLSALRLEVEWKRTVLAMFRTWHRSPSFSMPSLKLMEFAGWYAATPIDWLPMKDFFRDKAPGLQSLVQTQALPEPHFAVPPPTLKVFCGRVDATTFPSINACKDLEILEIHYFYQWDELEPTSLAPFNNLTSLHLVFHVFDDAVAHMPPLPSLKYLILTHDDKYHNQVDLHPMLRAWGAKLKYPSIIIDAKYTTPHDLQACLEFAPELEAIRFRWSDALHGVLKKVKLPRVTDCTFSIASMTPAVQNDFKEFAMCAKSDYFPRLTTVTIGLPYSDFSSRFESECLPMFATELSQIGVTLISNKGYEELGHFQFKGPYFNQIGGIFTSDLYIFNKN